MPDRATDLQWIKSSSSYASTQCVELAAAGDMIALRDSKNPDVRLYYTHGEINAFLEGAKRGEFDHLVLPDADAPSHAPTFFPVTAGLRVRRRPASDA